MMDMFGFGFVVCGCGRGLMLCRDAGPSARPPDHLPDGGAGGEVIVDWHNLAYTVLGENSLNMRHPLVGLARRIEWCVCVCVHLCPAPLCCRCRTTQYVALSTCRRRADSHARDGALLHVARSRPGSSAGGSTRTCASPRPSRAGSAPSGASRRKCSTTGRRRSFTGHH